MIILVRYLLTTTEREILKAYAYSYGETMKNKGHLNVILHRLRKLDLNVIRQDLDLIHKAMNVPIVNRMAKRVDPS